MRWVKKAGEECVRALDLCTREDWGQPLCVDEKWVKVRGKWNYVFTAVGAKLSDLLAIDLFHHKDREAMKTFLLQVKAMGFRPQSITTDLLLGYEGGGGGSVSGLPLPPVCAACRARRPTDCTPESAG